MTLNTQGAAQGALGGAAAGTAVVPGWGTAVGGIIGGLGGLFKKAPEPVDPMLAITGFTTMQTLGGVAVGGLLLFLAVR